MGNTESAKNSKKQQLKTAPEKKGQLSEGKKLIDTKNILLLHRSNAAQLEVVYNFRDALIGRTEGTVDVIDFVNIADGTNPQKNLEWLDEFNNIVLICLTSESIEDFRRIVIERGFADQNGQLHPKVFTVAFGEKLTSVWPPKGLKKGSTDLRDFHFEFSSVGNLQQQDFEKSLRLNSLIAAMKLTS